MYGTLYRVLYVGIVITSFLCTSNASAFFISLSDLDRTVEATDGLVTTSQSFDQTGFLSPSVTEGRATARYFDSNILDGGNVTEWGVFALFQNIISSSPAPDPSNPLATAKGSIQTTFFVDSFVNYEFGYQFAGDSGAMPFAELLDSSGQSVFRFESPDFDPTGTLTLFTGTLQAGSYTFRGSDTHSATSGLESSQLLVQFNLTAVPIPPALYLFGSGMIGLISIARHKKVV